MVLIKVGLASRNLGFRFYRVKSFYGGIRGLEGK